MSARCGREVLPGWSALLGVALLAPFGLVGPVSAMSHESAGTSLCNDTCNRRSYTVLGRDYHVLDTDVDYIEIGIASWYGRKFHGRLTSNGEIYDMHAMTAAHKVLPLPSEVRVTNLDNGRKVVVRVNDRGPFHDARLIDLSYAAAEALGFAGQGTAPVVVESLNRSVMEMADGSGVPVSSPTTTFFMQVGAFRERAGAERLRQRIVSRFDLTAYAGADVRILQSPPDDAAALHKVWLGPFREPAQHGALLAMIKAANLGTPLTIGLD